MISPIAGVMSSHEFCNCYSDLLGQALFHPDVGLVLWNPHTVGLRSLPPLLLMGAAGTPTVGMEVIIAQPP